MWTVIPSSLPRGEPHPAKSGLISPLWNPFVADAYSMTIVPATRKKSESRRRTAKPLQVRMNAPERQTLEERAAGSGLSVSDYVRVMCLGGKPLRKIRQRTPERVLLVKIETAINRIGNNVNQLAAKANSAGFLTPAEGEQLKELIARAHHVVERLLPGDDDDF